jgi:hypothetical protein
MPTQFFRRGASRRWFPLVLAGSIVIAASVPVTAQISIGFGMGGGDGGIGLGGGGIFPGSAPQNSAPAPSSPTRQPPHKTTSVKSEKPVKEATTKSHDDSDSGSHSPGVDETSFPAR